MGCHLWGRTESDTIKHLSSSSRVEAGVQYSDSIFYRLRTIIYNNKVIIIVLITFPVLQLLLLLLSHFSRVQLCATP